jgi:hypothetical protein
MKWHGRKKRPDERPNNEKGADPNGETAPFSIMSNFSATPRFTLFSFRRVHLHKVYLTSEAFSRVTMSEKC